MRLFKAVYKDRHGRQRKAAKWYIEFRDHFDCARRLVAFTDRRQSDEVARKIQKLVDARANGEGPDRELSKWLETIPARMRKRLEKLHLLSARTVAASKPLNEHLDDFKAALVAKGTSARHAEQTIERARRLIDACGFRFWSAITALIVERQLADMGTGGEGLSVQTRNFYLQAVKQFCKWMVHNRRATESPLEHLKGQNVQTDRRHDRRALAVNVLRCLIDTTDQGPERFGMAGHERALVYRLAVESGLRANEIRSLKRASFDLRSDPATVTVQAAYSKRRREDVLPLRPETRDALMRHLASKLPDARAFQLPRPYDMAQMMRADLADARAKWIAAAGGDDDRAEREKSTYLAYRGDAGRVADFHSLRHTFISNLAQAGVHPKLAQSLARHSDINLTMSRYTHTTRGAESEALAALPDLSPDRRDEARATGTDGRTDSGVAVLASSLAEKVSEGCPAVRLSAVDEAIDAAMTHTAIDAENAAIVPVSALETKIRLGRFELPTYGLGNRCSIP